MKIGDVIQLKKGDKYRDLTDASEFKRIKTDEQFIVEDSKNEGTLFGVFKVHYLVSTENGRRIKISDSKDSFFNIDRSVQVVGKSKQINTYMVTLNTGDNFEISREA